MSEQRCSRCGWAPHAAVTWCMACVGPRVWRHAAAELSIDVRAPLRYFRYDAGRHPFRDLRWFDIEILGVETPQPEKRPPYPFFGFLTNERFPGFFVQVWLAKAHYQESPLWAELRWRPEKWSLDLRGLQSSYSAEDLRRAEGGAKYLRDLTGFDNRGRREGSTNMTLEEFWEEEPQVRQRLRELYRREPSDVEVVQELPISIATYYRYKAKPRGTAKRNY